MKPHVYQLYPLVFSHSLRGKVFSWTEILDLTGDLPTHIQSIYSQDKIDPYWLFTQSAKPYYSVFSGQFLPTLYTHTASWKLYKNTYGVTINELQSCLNWKYFQDNSEWFWQQIWLSRIAFWLKAVPGVRDIYVVGSQALYVSQDSSDVDVAIQCYRFFCLPVRIYTKVLLKIFNLDVYSFWQRRSNHMGSYGSAQQVYRYSRKNKVDAGLYFESDTQLAQFFGYDERQIWLWRGAKYISPITTTSFTALGGGLWFDTSQSLSSKVLKVMLSIVLIFLFPVVCILSLLQLPLYSWRKITPNRLVAPRFISFIPRFHEERYLSAKISL